jgi:hypothetical protein
MHALNQPNASTARLSATTVIACLALALSGCAVGILLGRWTTSPAPASEHSVEAAAPQPDMRPLLEEIKRAIETLPQAMRERHDPDPASATGRESATTSSETLDRMTVAVERLNDLLARGAVGSGVGSTPTDVVKGPGYPSLEAVWQTVDSGLVPTDPDSMSKVNTELTRAHLLWRNEDLIQRYGASSGVGQKGSAIQLVYTRPQTPDHPHDVMFELSFGVVVRVGARW